MGVNLIPAIDPQATVAEIVVENLNRARVFERYGIDYCCGGTISLDLACSQQGADLAHVVEELIAAGQLAQPEDSGFDMELGELADHIEFTHHALMRTELPRLLELMAHVEGHHGARQPELRQAKKLLQQIAFELFDHMIDEELRLFPACREAKLGNNEVGLLKELDAEHKTVGKLLLELRNTLHGYKPGEGMCRKQITLLDHLAQLEADIHLHIHKEDNLLIPRLLARLPEE